MSYLLILLAVSLAVSAVGWKYFIYFFSLGYGFGIAALAVTLVIMFAGAVTAPTALLCAIMFIFGCRLGCYLLIREKKAANYRKILYDPANQNKKPIGVVVTVWVFCALLYVGQVSPVAFRLANTAAGAPVSEPGHRKRPDAVHQRHEKEADDDNQDDDGKHLVKGIGLPHTRHVDAKALKTSQPFRDYRAHHRIRSGNPKS